MIWHNTDCAKVPSMGPSYVYDITVFAKEVFAGKNGIKFHP